MKSTYMQTVWYGVRKYDMYLFIVVFKSSTKHMPKEIPSPISQALCLVIIPIQRIYVYIYIIYMGVSKNRSVSPKMDGENNGKPYFLMDDLGIPLFLETPKYTHLMIHEPRHLELLCCFSTLKLRSFIP